MTDDIEIQALSELIFHERTKVVALPNWDLPKLILPVRGFLEGVSDSALYPAYKRLAKAHRLIVRARMAAGLTSVRELGSARTDLKSLLELEWPEANPTAMFVGTEGPTRKIVVRFSGKNGRSVGYMKYAVRSQARIRLAEESRMLSSIPVGRGPVALRNVVREESTVLLTSAVPGRTLGASYRIPDCVVELSESLSRDDCPASGIEDHPLIKEIISDGVTSVERHLEVLADRAWPATIQHGDLAPWNVVREPSGRAVAVDWEYGRMDGFPYFDLAHYMLQTLSLVYRWTPQKARKHAAAQILATPECEINSAQADAIVCLSAYNAYRSSCEDGHSDDELLQHWRRELWESEPGRYL